MTDDTTINLDDISKAGVDRLLRYRPIFAEPNRVFGTPSGFVTTGEREVEIVGESLGAEEIAFLEACYEEHFLQSFDWMEWVHENPDVAQSMEYIRAASFVQLVMLITGHLRMDRFSGNHLFNCFCDGTIQATLERLGFSRAEMV